MKKLMTLAMLALIGVMVFGMLGSGAWFTDSATSQANTITAGTLSIKEGWLSQQVISVDNLAPGEVTQDVELYITTDGNVPLAWMGDLQITGDTAEALKDVIYIDYAKMEYIGGNWDEPDDTFIAAGRGSGSWPTCYNVLADLSPYKVVTLKNYDGNGCMAPGLGNEFMGALKPGYAYKLTLRFGMVKDAGNTYQSMGPLTINLKVDATQANVEALNALKPGLGGHFGFFESQLKNQD
jgi:predicted ribosomally synthesized peptide with SipW-like signal peptide